MTPTAPELLAGCATALSRAPAAEEGEPYRAGVIGLVVLIDLLCAQECAQGAEIRVWENATLRCLLAEDKSTGLVRSDCDPDGVRDVGEDDLSLAALDRANADLRRRLIRLHEVAEAAGDRPLDRRILALYRVIARRRRLHLPPVSAVGR